jgi:pSer/pThr/pTyr-binding forkhead associated (FHA) protein
MTSPSLERHVLVIEYPDYEQAIHLEAVAYSIGRDVSNAIVLDVDTLSRQHAILLRVPDPATRSYSYRLVDGNATGRASANGVFVNGQRCSIHALGDGDHISFGRKIRARYRRLKMEQNEFSEYLKSIDYQSLKAKQIDSKATLVSDDMITGGLSVGMPPTGEFTQAGVATANQRSVLTETVHEPDSKKLPLVWMGLMAGIVCAGIASLFWLGQSGQSPGLQPQPQTSIQQVSGNLVGDQGK